MHILRSRIEEVNRGCVDARRRFELAEAEYVGAKTEMHRLTEQKEQLTDHLMLIIQESEARKARKLETLMEKMALPEAGAVDAGAG